MYEILLDPDLIQIQKERTPTLQDSESERIYKITNNRIKMYKCANNLELLVA